MQKWTFPGDLFDISNVRWEQYPDKQNVKVGFDTEM